MGFNLFPRIIQFFDLFKKQNQILVESIGLLNDIFVRFTSVPATCKQIIDKESEGDQVSREISLSLAQTFITPIDREDIHAINMAQEKVLNSIRSISTRIGLYPFGSIKPGARELVSMLKAQHDEIALMVASLEKKRDMKEQIQKVKVLKMEADTLLLVAMGEIYENSTGDSGQFMELMMWSQIYDRIEEAFDSTELLNNILEGIALKYS